MRFGYVKNGRAVPVPRPLRGFGMTLVTGPDGTQRDIDRDPGEITGTTPLDDQARQAQAALEDASSALALAQRALAPLKAALDDAQNLANRVPGPTTAANLARAHAAYDPAAAEVARLQAVFDAAKAAAASTLAAARAQTPAQRASATAAQAAVDAEAIANWRAQQEVLGIRIQQALVQAGAALRAAANSQ